MFQNRPVINKETPVQVQTSQAKFSELKGDFILIRDAVQKI